MQRFAGLPTFHKTTKLISSVALRVFGFLISRPLPIFHIWSKVLVAGLQRLNKLNDFIGVIAGLETIWCQAMIQHLVEVMLRVRASTRV